MGRNSQGYLCACDLGLSRDYRGLAVLSLSNRWHESGECRIHMAHGRSRNAGAGAPEIVISRHVERSLWHSAEISRAALEMKLPVFHATKHPSIDEVETFALQYLSQAA